MGWTCYLNPVCAGKQVGRTIGQTKRLARQASSARNTQDLDPEQLRNAYITLMAITGIFSPAGAGVVINAAVADVATRTIEDSIQKQVEKIQKKFQKLRNAFGL